MHTLKIFLIGFLLLLQIRQVSAQQISTKFTNQISSWATLNVGDPVKTLTGIQYIPTLSIIDSLSKNRKFDAEISGNLKADALFTKIGLDDKNIDLKPYRAWIRYSAARLEIRLGLQKINFGSASVIRPLMWFDQMDYRDPLQLTDGVYALLARYYFQNNTNIWLWSLYGNNKPMGWDAVASKPKTPEFGGRIQQPVPRGEIGLSYHHRMSDFSGWLDTIPFVVKTSFPENKIGIDGKWDIGPGLGFEYVIKQNGSENPLNKEWETYFNLNIDYTFNFANGLTMNWEFFRYNLTDELTKTGIKNTFTALTATYPFGLMNNVTAVIYYNREPNEWSRFISFQRKYDYWTFYLIGFWNPDNFTLNSTTSSRKLYAGKGFQAMAVVNF